VCLPCVCQTPPGGPDRVFHASRPSRGVVSCVALGLPGHPPKGVVPRYPPRGVLRDCSRPVPGSCRGVVSPLSGGFPHKRRFNFGSRSPAAVRAHVHRRVRRLTPSTVGPFPDRFVRWLHGDAGWRSPLQRDAALANACAKDHVSQFVIMPTGYGKTLAALLPAPLKQKAAVMATASDLFAVQEGSGHAPRGHFDRTTAPQASARGPLPFTRGSADPGNRSVRI